MSLLQNILENIFLKYIDTLSASQIYNILEIFVVAFILKSNSTKSTLNKHFSFTEHDFKTFNTFNIL